MGVLLSAISFPLTRCHITCRNGKRSAIYFPDEERNQVPPGFRPAKRSVNIFAVAMSALNESKLGIVSEKLLNFMHLNAVFSTQLLDDLVEPDEAFDVQR